MKNFVLISKDAICTDYLPAYGNTYWHTPNIDELAKKGTVFHNHYTAAPSTVMAFYAMAMGNWPYETKYEMYEKVHERVEGETAFSRLREKGYECHLVWDEEWMTLLKYYDYYRDDIKIHALDGLRQGVGSHYIHDGFLAPDPQKTEKAWNVVKTELERIFFGNQNNIFLWIHFPHVINGYTSYGADIEAFDRFVGLIRTFVDDDCIAVTADHGNQNGHKGKIGYAFDVYQESIRIPLITPNYHNISDYYKATSNIDLFEIIFGNVKEREFIYSDTAYRAQKQRKLAIIYDHYKYVYTKASKREELFDLNFGSSEEFSLMDDYVYDADRKIKAPSRELYYYPQWDQLPEIRQKMRTERNRIWKDGSTAVSLKSSLKELVKPVYRRIKKKKIR